MKEIREDPSKWRGTRHSWMARPKPSNDVSSWSFQILPQSKSQWDFFFKQVARFFLHFKWKVKGTRIAKVILKKNKIVEFIPPNFKILYKVTVFQIMGWVVVKDRPMEESKKQSHTCGQLTFDGGTKAIQWRRGREVTPLQQPCDTLFQHIKVHQPFPFLCGGMPQLLLAGRQHLCKLSCAYSFKRVPQASFSENSLCQKMFPYNKTLLS